MGRGRRKIVRKKVPEEGPEDLFATEEGPEDLSATGAFNVDESSSGNEAEDDSDHEPTQDNVQKDPEPDRTASQPKAKKQRHYHIIPENHIGPSP